MEAKSKVFTGWVSQVKSAIQDGELLEKSTKNDKNCGVLPKIILQLIRSDVQLTADAKRKHGH